MKRTGLIFFVLCIAVVTLFLETKKDNLSKKYNDDEEKIDEEMAGPEGEVIYVGSGGGRYFIKNGKKIFVGYRANT